MRLALGDTIWRPDGAAGADLRGEDTTASGIEATDAVVGAETSLASGSSDSLGAASSLFLAAFFLASAISSLVSAT